MRRNTKPDAMIEVLTVEFENHEKYTPITINRQMEFRELDKYRKRLISVMSKRTGMELKVVLFWSECPVSDEIAKFYKNIKPTSIPMPNLTDKAFFKPVQASL